MTQLSAPVQILAVSGKQIVTKRGDSTIYEIKASDGREYSTFNSPVAQKANGLVNGDPVLLQYEEVTKGQYTNYRLGDIIIPDGAGAVLPVNQANPTVTSIPAPVTLTTAPVAAQSTIPVSSHPQGAGTTLQVSTTTPDEKDARIARAVALKAALEFRDGPDVVKTAEAFAHYLLTGKNPEAAPEPVAAPEPAQAGLTSTEIDW